MIAGALLAGAAVGARRDTALPRPGGVRPPWRHGPGERAVLRPRRP